MEQSIQQTSYTKDIQSAKHSYNPCFEVQLEAVKKFGPVIQYINNPCLQVQLEAVKEYGSSIQYIDNPCFEVQLEAVKKDAYCIQHIKNPSNYIYKVSERLLSNLGNIHDINDL